MPYARPTLTELIEQATNDFVTGDITDPNGNTVDGLLPIGFIPALGMVVSGQSYEHYGYIDWISQQAVPWTATDEYLAGWAALKRVFRKAATTTMGTVTFSTAAPATDIPAGTAISRSDGVQFVTSADTPVSGASVTVPITAVVAGSSGNFASDTGFVLANPINGVAAQSTASAQLVAGTDTETDDAFRTRMLGVYAAPPQGGDRQDYIEWALAIPSVTRAWVSNSAGAGTVSVYFMMDVAEAAYDGFPQGSNGVATNEPRDTTATGDQLTVANALFPLQPVTALVYALAPAATPVNFTVADLGAANTTPNQGLITTALEQMFAALGQVGGTVNPATGAAWPGIEPDAWYSAIAAVPGLTGFKVTTPSALITPSAGQLFTLGTITFVS
jgi:uncharacterized phage protein gp47/JayE